MIDPVTLVVVQNGLQQVASEMDLTFERAAFSPVISEAFDRSNGIYHRDTGEVIAQGEMGLPIFVGVMQFTTQAVIERRHDLEPGDVIIVNDPYLGGTHLMDVRFVKPFFHNGSVNSLEAVMENVAHRSSGTGGVDALQSAAQRAQLIRFLLSIDGATVPILSSAPGA